MADDGSDEVTNVPLPQGLHYYLVLIGMHNIKSNTDIAIHDTFLPLARCLRKQFSRLAASQKLGASTTNDCCPF